MKIKAIIKTLQNKIIDNTTHDGYSLLETNLSVEEYLSTYRLIGKKYCWWMKQVWEPEQIEFYLKDETIKTYWIIYESEKIGFVEIHLYPKNSCYIQYFGLFDNFIGIGHGKKSLDFILNFCKNNLSISNIFTTTNNLDHENALNVYLKCGFSIINEHEEIWDIPVEKVEIEITERNKIWLH